MAKSLEQAKERARRINERLGNSGAPEFTLEVLRLDLLDTNTHAPGGEEPETDVEGFDGNIETVGLLQTPGVKPAPEGRYTVIYGNRRVKWLRRAGKFEVMCRVYPGSLSAATIALMRLSENRRRSYNWAAEVSSIMELIEASQEDGVGLSTEDIAFTLGVPVQKIVPLFKMATLPEPLNLMIARGTVKRALAGKILSLPKGDIARLAELVRSGEELTEKLVKGLSQAYVSRSLEELPEWLNDSFGEDTEEEEEDELNPEEEPGARVIKKPDSVGGPESGSGDGELASHLENMREFRDWLSKQTSKPATRQALMFVDAIRALFE